MSTSINESFRVDQPQPNDIVGSPVLLAGMGGGFEGTIDVRLLDEEGDVIIETFAQSTNLTSAWQSSVTLPSNMTAKRGVIQIGPSGGEGQPAMVSVPVFFGSEIVSGYSSFVMYTIQPGDTLASIAADNPLFAGTSWQALFDANQHIIGDPNQIVAGTQIRIPANF